MNWFALHCHSNYEARIKSCLQRVDIEEFWPTIQRVTKVRHGNKLVQEKKEVSLLPGYVFARFDPQHQKLQVISIPGVARIVGFSESEPAAIPDEEIEALRTLITHGIGLTSVDYEPKAGDKVKIKHGAFVGSDGEVEWARGEKAKVRVSVHLLRKTVEAFLTTDYLELISRSIKPTTETKPCAS